MTVSLGSNHSCAVKISDLRLVCWGDNEYKQCEDRYLGLGLGREGGYLGIIG